jgi:hypothetical protein
MPWPRRETGVDGVRDRKERGDRGPGVPEAIPRGVQRIVADLGLASVDRIWIFPPLVNGRRESGLLTVSVFKEGDDPDRRVLAILPYSAERTGKGLTIESAMAEQGEAPLDRLPRVMEGVVKRTDHDLGDPREVEIQGDPEKLQALLDEFAPELLDPELPPLAPAEASNPPAAEVVS